MLLFLSIDAAKWNPSADARKVNSNNKQIKIELFLSHAPSRQWQSDFPLLEKSNLIPSKDRRL